MSVIGQQIKKYRMENGFTQEQVGRKIGVTTQAVSKWERGSTPDAEILPLIADALGVSVDALYGREERSLAVQLAKKLCKMQQEEAYRYAFGICWAIEIGLSGEASAIDDFMDMFIDRTFTENGKSADYFAKLINDSGIALTRMSPDFSHFFLMAESAGKSIMPHFENISELKKVFAVFADEKTLNIICYLYSLPHMPVAVSLICKHTGYNHIEVEKTMRRLCDNHLVIRTMIATADGEMSSYSVRPEGFAVPLLCFADEIAKNNPRPFFGTFDRKKPFL